jgi:hypothetical protein
MYQSSLHKSLVFGKLRLKNHFNIFPPDLCRLSCRIKMPKVKRSRKAPPDGWELIEPTLDELDQKMREGEWGHSCQGGWAKVPWSKLFFTP